MLSSDEVTWLKSTANQLNNLLQQIYGYAHRTQTLTQDNPLVHDYIQNITGSVERATLVTQEILEHLYRTEMAASSSAPGQQQPQVPFFPTQPQPLPVRPPEPKPAERLTPPQAYQPIPFQPPPQPQHPGTPRPGFKTERISLTRIAPKVERAQTPTPPLPPHTGAVQDSTQIDIANPTGPGELVMVVDDEEHVLLLVKMMLVEAGYRVIAAKDGFQAISIYKKLSNEIDLVILDSILPIMDGSEVFAELRAINPKVAVMLSSGFAEQAKVNQMLANGLRGFIPKPYTQEKLLLQIRSALDSMRS